ncbi:MAG TPA: tetratricopeptide repeat protein [Candidatus Methylacidiphilales bacterium]|nr:tetratricopeptide repeat protein [Candidatus Methylacidiphilales bacterium]
MARLQSLLLIALGIWIFAPALRGGWLWDDDKYITRNPLITDPGAFWRVLSWPDGLGNYDPLTSAIRWLQWQCWGDHTFGYHLTNLALHLASALLLWRLFERLRIPCAWIGALVFTVHPVMVESVAWIAELKNTLSLPPLLLAMLAFLDYTERGRRSGYFRALGWFVVSMLAKTAGLMLPVIFLGYAWWKRGKVGWNDLKASAPFFLVALVAGLVSVFPHGDSSNPPEVVATGGWLARLASLGWAGLFLLGEALFPVDLMPAYPGNAVETSALTDMAPWLLLAGCFWLCWRKRETWGRAALAGFGFFLINLVPVFGFIAINDATMTWSMDHLVYLPIIGLAALFAAGAGAIIKRLPPEGRPLAEAAALLIVAGIAFAARGYATKFTDEETLWRYAVERNPHFILAQENLGKALLVNTQPEEAQAHFEEMLRLQPQRAASHYDLGKALVQMGRIEEGIAEYRRALSLDPTNAEAENNLGVALLQANRLSEAAAHFAQAIRLKPGYAIAYDNLGTAQAAMGQYQTATDNFARALELTPRSAEAHDNMGYALLKLGRKDEAEKYFQRALQIDPDDEKARDGLAKAGP